VHKQYTFNFTTTMDETRRFHNLRPASERTNLCNEAEAE